MDTRFLESFIAVVDQGSLAGAARRLNLSPAAVAQRIHALENEFGMRLLTRAGRKVQPTDAGRAILERGRQWLDDARDMRSAAAGGTISGELRLGGINSALTGILPDILARLIGRHPGIDIFLKPGSSKDLYNEILVGSLDAGVIVEPRFPIPKSHVFKTLREEPLILLAPAGYATEDPLSLLEKLPLIRYDRSHWGGHIADEYLKRQDRRPRELLEVDSLDGIVVMVSKGLGISLVPDWAPPWPAGADVAKIPLPLPAAMRRVGLFYGRASPRQNLVNVLCEASFEP